MFRQWRNSYGLRVGKPAGTRAEGAPEECPFTLVFQLRLPFQKSAPFQHFCEILIMMHPIDEIRIIWVPLQLELGSHFDPLKISKHVSNL